MPRWQLKGGDKSGVRAGQASLLSHCLYCPWPLGCENQKVNPRSSGVLTVPEATRSLVLNLRDGTGLRDKVHTWVKSYEFERAKFFNFQSRHSYPEKFIDLYFDSWLKGSFLIPGLILISTQHTACLKLVIGNSFKLFMKKYSEEVLYIQGYLFRSAVSLAQMTENSLMI